MWYEGKMVTETLDSLQRALDAAPDVKVKLSFCINLQTYIEKPEYTIEMIKIHFII